MACAGSPRHVTAALAVIALVPAGCFPLGGPKAGELRSAAASLVPRHSRVLEQYDSDCVEFEPSPSCRLIYFIAPPRATLLLAREVETKARNAGWSVVRKDVFQGGHGAASETERLERVRLSRRRRSGERLSAAAEQGLRELDRRERGLAVTELRPRRGLRGGPVCANVTRLGVPGGSSKCERMLVT